MLAKVTRGLLFMTPFFVQIPPSVCPWPAWRPANLPVVPTSPYDPCQAWAKNKFGYFFVSVEIRWTKLSKISSVGKSADEIKFAAIISYLGDDTVWRVDSNLHSCAVHLFALHAFHVDDELLAVNRNHSSGLLTLKILLFSMSSFTLIFLKSY